MIGALEIFQKAISYVTILKDYAMNNKLRQLLTLNKILLLGFIFFLPSCFSKSKYIAVYTVQVKDTDKNTKEITINFINQLADKYSLNKDTKYNGNDTLGFYGQPYHYFKFWFEQQGNNNVLKLDYWGNSGNRNKKFYQDFFKELGDFMEDNFFIIEQVIEKENDSKKDNP